MSKKIQATKNYRLFGRSDENRPFDMKKHRRLMESMKLYGFLQEFPIVCVRDSKGNLVVKDGQHRLAIAESLGIAVFWIEASKDWDVAVVNSTAKPWVVRDYAEKHAANGLSQYAEGLAFADQHHLTIGVAFSLLSGTTSFGNAQRQFIEGTFKIKDRKWADDVASVYTALTGLSPDRHFRNARLIEACMAVCRVPEFEPKRLIANAERCREKLVPYSNRESYLSMLEAVYNFGRTKLFGLKSAAEMAMRDRNVLRNKAGKKKGHATKLADAKAA